MPLWIRYDPVRAVWEVSPNESENYFSDLLEHHPREVIFSRWIELAAFADARAADALFRPISGPANERRVRIYDNGDFIREIRRRKQQNDIWGASQANTMPAVAPAGAARLIFDKITSRLKLSQNGGPWYDVVPSVLNQQDANTIPLKIVCPSTTGSGTAPNTVTGLTGWWKADSGVYKDAGVTLAANGETCQQWNDNSGGAHHLPQATAVSRPTYFTGYQNALPALVFDGSNDEFTFGPTHANLLFTSLSAWTIFYAGKSIGSSLVPILIYDSSVGTAIQLGGSAGNVTVNNHDGTLDGASKAGTLTNWHIGFGMHSAGNIYAGYSDVRSASLGSTASGNTTQTTGSSWSLFTRSSGSYHNYALGELLTYSTDMNDDTRKGIEVWLAAKWGVTLPYASYGNVDLFRIEDQSGNVIFRISAAGAMYVGTTQVNVP